MRIFFAIILDIITVFFSFWLSHIIKFSSKIPVENYEAYLFIIPFLLTLSLILYIAFGLYKEKRIINLEIAGKFLISNLLQILIIFIIILFINTYSQRQIPLSRAVFVIFYVIENFLIFFEKIFYEQILRFGKREQNILIIGEHQKQKEYLKMLRNEIKNSKFHNIKEIIKKESGSKISSDELVTIIEQYNIKYIIFFDLNFVSDIFELLEQNKVLRLEFILSPEIYNRLVGKVKLKPLENSPFFLIVLNPITGINYILKRLFDIIVSLFFIILTLPLFPIISLIILIDSEGPVFFKQVRIGKGGKQFNIIKFRTMIRGAEIETGPTWTEKDDKRITRVGKFLRRFSLDELPQFYLALIGKMSIIGPRPERPYFYNLNPQLKGLRLSVKPGITGLAQINGRYNLSMEEKLNYDIYYINNYSLLLDLEIFIKSIIIVLTQSGAR